MAMEKGRTAFARQLAGLNRINRILLEDLRRSLDPLQEAYAPLETPTESFDSDLFNYALKRTIRCLLGWVDATAFFLCDTVVQCAPQMKYSMTPSERKHLRRPGGGPRGSLQLGYDSFAKLISSSLRLDTDSNEWNAFSDLVDVRNDFTHPEGIGHLVVSRATHLLKPVMLWFGHLNMKIMSEADRLLGIHALEKHGQLELPDVVIEAPSENLGEIFDAEFYQLLGESAVRSIKYLRVCLGIIGNETVRAATEVPTGQNLHSPTIQFAYRNLVRSISTEVEGISHFLLHELERGAGRDEFVLSAGDRKRMTEGNVEEKLVATASIWSREAGDGRVPKTVGSGFTALGEVRGIRNRITHPRKVKELQIDTKRIAVILRAIGWLTEELHPSISITDTWKPDFQKEKDP